MAQINCRLLHWMKRLLHPGTRQDGDTSEGEVDWNRLIRFCVNRRPTSRRESEKLWRLALDESGDMPGSSEQLLDDYCLAFNITSPNAVAIHFRIDAVLLSILATAKKEEANSREHTNPDAESNTESDVEDTLYLDCLVKFSIMRTIKGEQITLAHNVDRILWYGDRDELDTNLIVIRKESPLNTEDCSPLAPMALIHHAHRLAGRKTEIYGICTDSCRWNFMHINKEGRVSRLSLYWLHDQQQIIRQVRCIIRQAVTLHGEAGSSRRLETCSELTGYKILYQSNLCDSCDAIVE
ncbi:hypothetical protein BDV40DRAFT_296222 [Aspergillus tamarii]|uniref:Uncharacterized protein n=1 Tax=Aspergillus tamarii TaxID=41984 RepID=A0A5N6VA76_ASPTM|nr:hypothetical protein BDV40DRAFT_296222 [Aspergillus tamarii]